MLSLALESVAESGSETEKVERMFMSFFMGLGGVSGFGFRV